MRRGAVTLAGAFLVALPVAAQTSVGVRSPVASVPSVFWTDRGVSVEVAGLRRWTGARVDAAVKRAGLSLFGGAYEARTLPGVFPQSIVYQNMSDSVVTVFVALIEPEDARRVTVRAFPANPAAAKARQGMAWLALGKLADAPYKVLERGILERLHARAAGLRPALWPSAMADSAELTQVWTTLDAYHTVEAGAAARKVLLTSPNADDRVAAVAILSTFDRDDAAWHALAGALLDPKEKVRQYARMVLGAFVTDLARPVDWRPAAADLRALLDGSDLYSLRDVMLMLVTTGAGPELAAPVLRRGGYAVLLFAGARHAWAREPAQRFLRAVSGREGAVPAEWRKWVAGL